MNTFFAERGKKNLIFYYGETDSNSAGTSVAVPPTAAGGGKQVGKLKYKLQIV
jgi:hypothetical protein